MTSIVDMIRTNDPSLIDLRLTESPEAYCADLNDLVAALKENQVIDYVRLDRDFLPSFGIDQQDQVRELFLALAGLPALKEAQIWHASIHVSVLACFIQKTRDDGTLQHLQLGCLDLEGTADDFVQVSNALREHPSIAKFSMCDFSLHDDAISMDDLISTLATLPKLQAVKLEVSASRRRSVVGDLRAAKSVKVSLTGHALATVCASPTLEELHLNRLDLRKEDFHALAESLKVAPSLVSFSLPHCNLDDEACIKLAYAIGQSPKLARIDMSCNKLTDEGCVTLASALKGNQTVKFLRLWGNVKISNAGFDAVREMLEQNCVLERVPLMSPIDYEAGLKNVEQKRTGGSAA